MLCDPTDQQHHQCPRLQPDTMGYGHATTHTRCPDGSRPHYSTADALRSHGAKATPAKTGSDLSDRSRQRCTTAPSTPPTASSSTIHLLHWTTGLLLERCPWRSRPKDPMEGSSNCRDDRTRPNRPSNKHVLDHTRLDTPTSFRRTSSTRPQPPERHRSTTESTTSIGQHPRQKHHTVHRPHQVQQEETNRDCH